MQVRRHLETPLAHLIRSPGLHLGGESVGRAVANLCGEGPDRLVQGMHGDEVPDVPGVSLNHPAGAATDEST
jgi:hypothetical protein